MRSRLPDFLTLPSSTLLTCRARPISSTLTFLALNENEEVRAATFKFSIFASALSSSSARPSQKYSFSGSALMFANGSTAIEGVTRSRPVVNSSLGREAGRFIVADSDSEASEARAATSSVPSRRQNFSVSSVSTRLQVGQRFIFGVRRLDAALLIPVNYEDYCSDKNDRLW